MQENTSITLEHAGEVIGLAAKTLEVIDHLTAKLIEKRFLYEVALEDPNAIAAMFGAKETPTTLAQQIASISKQKDIVSRVLQKITDSDDVTAARETYMTWLLLNERITHAREMSERIEYNGETTNDDLDNFKERFGDPPQMVAANDIEVMLSMIEDLPISNLADVPVTRSLVIN